MSQESPVTYHSQEDDKMKDASKQARESFKYFWKEVAFDFNRIVPALQIACVKAPFSDNPKDPYSTVEHMWISDINFDGNQISGTLMNTPNNLQSFKKGDIVLISVEELSDWMCVLSDEVFGAFTVQVTREDMNERDRKQFDEAWGLNFPEKAKLPPNPPPFADVIANQLEVELRKDPSLIDKVYGNGMTLLHLDCLYGRDKSVMVLLEAGAKFDIKCDKGRTPLDYAKSLGWVSIINQIENRKIQNKKE